MPVCNELDKGMIRHASPGYEEEEEEEEEEEKGKRRRKPRTGRYSAQIDTPSIHPSILGCCSWPVSHKDPEGVLKLNSMLNSSTYAISPFIRSMRPPRPTRLPVTLSSPCLEYENECFFRRGGEAIGATTLCLNEHDGWNQWTRRRRGVCVCE
ncbi:hypothetical protein LX32DRAFT_340498 [Colletotrichum zoysiae]|uniref:Uncharacterized protein n=1 Tax=Colletotrichum zoysiae TaxID=1216348 RepID=A0AAD9HT66_9PEZI|nr:hypothetical protein LX32DRAFT_340498 [Colletotrichum zoysiae]